MIAIIGTVLGLLGSLAPELLKFLNNKEDHKHEIAILTMQVEASKIAHAQRIEEINVQADIGESQALYKAAEIKLTGNKWLDGIMMFYQSSVRPTLTYMFFFAYMLVKYAQYRVFIDNGYKQWNIISTMWNQDDFAIFSTIMGFWFGQRMIKWALERGKK